MKKIIASNMAFFFLFGCASATLVKSNPLEGNYIWMDSSKGRRLIPTLTERQQAR